MPGKEIDPFESPPQKPCFSTLILLIFCYLCSLITTQSNRNANLKTSISPPNSIIQSFNCYDSRQSHPVIANLVEGVKYPFPYSLSDFGTLPNKPHKNIVRILKGNLFRRPDISATVQELLEKMKGEGKMSVFVDVGANVVMAMFAATVMGFPFFAFEPVFENLRGICNDLLQSSWGFGYCI